MIEPISRFKVVQVLEPLPSCWLRKHDTKPDDDRQSRDGIFRIGPQGAFHRTLIEAINQAREVVLAASFLFADEGLAEAFLKASARGVRVYMLTASEESLKKLGAEDDEFETRMADEHAQLLDRLAGKVLVRSAPHFHAKFLVIDPNGSIRGWLSTANFNKALRESVELGFQLTQEQARALAGWFSWAFWNEAEHELLEKGRLARVSPPPQEPGEPTGGQIEVTTKKHHSLLDGILSLIENAKEEIIISSFGLEANHPVIQALVNKAVDGVRITVLTRPRPGVREAVEKLESAGALVLAHDKLHAKAIVTECSSMLFTANIESHGLDHGFEVGVRLNDQQRNALRQILLQWRKTFPWQYACSAKREDHIREICLAEKGLRDGRREVVKEQSVHLESVTADDALRLDSTPDPECKPPHSDKFPQLLRFEWEVHPPKLPPKAKERLRDVNHEAKDEDGNTRTVTRQEPYDPPVFEHAGKVYIVLRNQADIEPARNLAVEIGAKVVLK